MGVGKLTSLEICSSFMEVILWHLLEPETEFLTHDVLCQRSQLGINSRDSSRYLKDVWDICREKGCPNLAIMVINQRSKLPGDWYYDLYEALYPTVRYQRGQRFKEEVEKVKSFLNWHELAQCYQLSESLILQLSLRSLKLQQLQLKVV
ncbi:hypothetical protein [Turicibacter sanguinis]|uniref:hypothetical protein n=1 Tax=Turicibacter sanguinis TaxID=154288 RepID=UPI0018AB1BEF|nr:hypothetical protein [Turicibacter sanguinis]MDB8559593.1 hypothetical protein [Turicibacter sanguinis]MDB8561046.1 hypothetical protein [Turicibacter sanguinis]